MKLGLRIHLFLLLVFVGCISSEYSCDKTFRRILGEWVKKSRKEGLIAVGTGGGIKDEKITRLGISFDTTEVMYIDAAREKILDTYGLLLNILDQHPEYNIFFPGGEFKIDIVSLSVLGPAPEDPYVDYVSAVSLRFGEVYYNKIDPDEKIRPYIHLHEETYEEALEIVQQGSASVTQAESA